jgi:hypothetical protein
MQGLSVETAARDGSYLFLRFCPFVVFESIHNNVWLMHEIIKCTWEETGVYDGIVETIAIIELIKFLSVFILYLKDKSLGQQLTELVRL